MNKPVTFTEVNAIFKEVEENMTIKDWIPYLEKQRILCGDQPIYYREHRGSLEDSLATTRSYASWPEFHKEVGFDDIKDYGYDGRCNQILWLVLKDGRPLGFRFIEKVLDL